MKVLIIGAGPTGLTAALEFARQGIKVEIVDAKEEPSPMSRAVGILPRSLDILSKTGVSARLLAEGIKPKHLHIEKDGSPLVDLDLPEKIEDGDFLISLPQDRTEALMSEKLEEMGVSVKYGRKVADIKNDEDGAVGIFEDGTSTGYDWVIAADGVRSTVRQKLGIPYEGYELDEDWSIADVELQGDHNLDTFYAWLLKNNRTERDVLIMIPIAPNRVRLVSSLPDSLGAIPIKLDIKNVRRSGMFKISVRQAKQYVVGRVVLAGDAAHAHSPVGGRGMNLGIEDAHAAVDAILHNKLEQYERERKKKAKGIIDGTERVRKILVSSNPLTLVLVRMTMWVIQNVTFVRKKFLKRVMSL